MNVSCVSDGKLASTPAPHAHRVPAQRSRLNSSYRMATPLDLVRTPAFLLKVVELILACVCVALFASSTQDMFVAVSTMIVIIGTYVGFLMISIIVVISNIINSPLNKILLLLINLPAAILFVTAGVLLLDSSRGGGHFIVSGVLAIINGLVYLVDFALLAMDRTTI